MDDYEEARILLLKVKFRLPVYDLAEHPEQIDRETLRCWVEPALPGLDRLIQGTRRSECRGTRNLQSGGRNNVRAYLFTPVGQLRADLLTEEGRPFEAARLLLDLMRMSDDCARNGTWVDILMAVQARQPCLLRLKLLIESGALNNGELLQISEELRRLEDDLPGFGAGMIVNTVEFGQQLLRAGTLEKFQKECEIQDKVPFWRQGVAGRHAMVQSWEVSLLAAQIIAESDARSWSEASRANREACSAIAAARNSLFKTLWFGSGKPDYLPWMKTCREGLTQLRLLRVALQYRVTGTLPDAEDPFGDQLKFRKTGHVFRIWSVGANGQDDEGSGGWNPKLGRDIVIEIRR